MSDDRLLDEHILRRALRLEADEMPARFDPRFIAAAAREGRVAQRTVAMAVAAAFVGGWIWSELFWALLATASDVTGIDIIAVAVGAIDAVALRVAPLADVATAPAIPIAIFAAALVAVLFETRGRIHVTAS